MKLTRKEYATPEEKKKDLERGFWLWWAANLVMLVLVGSGLYALGAGAFLLGGTPSTPAQPAAIVLGLIPLLVNVAALIYLGLTRSQMALGALWAIGSALAVVGVLLPLAAAAACFAVLSTY